MTDKKEKLTIHGLEFNKPTEEDIEKGKQEVYEEIKQKVNEKRQKYGDSIITKLYEELYAIEYVSVRDDKPELVEDYHKELLDGDIVPTIYFDKPTRYKTLKDNINTVLASNLSKHANKNDRMRLLDKYTFESFRTEKSHHKIMKETAERFINEEGWGMCLLEQTGCGKTHLGVATATQLLLKGHDVHYLQWKDSINELKDWETGNELVRKLINVEVLYIDDFLKVPRNDISAVSKADIDVAFKIIDGRYSLGKRTIITSEFTMSDFMELEGALGGRIFEMCEDYTVQIAKKEGRNERLNNLNIA